MSLIDDLRLEPSVAWSTRVFRDVARKARYWEVLVMRTQRGVDASRRELCLPGSGKRGWHVRGYCHGFEIRGPDGQRTTKAYGVVVLQKAYLSSPEYVAHEFTHAAHFTLLRTCDFCNMRLDDEAVIEPLADLVGWYMSQFSAARARQLHVEEVRRWS